MTTEPEALPRWPAVPGHDPRTHGHAANGLCPPACRRRQGSCPWPDTCGCDHTRCFAGWIDTARGGYDVTVSCPRCRPVQHIGATFDEPQLMCANPDHARQALPCRLCAADAKAAG
jgi:hypothetical protein